MGSAPWRIVVVDHDNQARDAYQKFLLEDPARRFDVVMAESVESAATLCSTGLPDCLVLDHELVDDKGLELLVRPGQIDNGYSRVAVILLGREEQKVASAAKKYDAHDWLVKEGVTPMRMRQAVALAVEKRELRRDVARFRDALQQSQHDGAPFASIASHELFAPVRRIDGFCQLLKKKYEDKLDQEGKEFIGFIVDGARQMQAQVEDLWTFSRLTTRLMKPEPVDCSEALHVVEAQLVEPIRECNAQVTNDPLPRIRADRQQLIRLFRNLVDNSLKFHGDRNPLIHVACDHVEGHWQFCVRDNGIGIEAKFAEYIFGPFQRLHNEEEYAGTGMGLAICQRIVELHGGRIWMESVPDSGSACYFTMPNSL